MSLWNFIEIQASMGGCSQDEAIPKKNEAIPKGKPQWGLTKGNICAKKIIFQKSSFKRFHNRLNQMSLIFHKRFQASIKNHHTSIICHHTSIKSLSKPHKGIQKTLLSKGDNREGMMPGDPQGDSG